MKKVFALLLSVAMVICMMPSMAFAAPGDPQTLTVTGGTVTVDEQEQTGTEDSDTGAITYSIDEGATVTIIADEAPSGKVFDKWVVTDDKATLTDANSETTTFTMPGEAVTVEATYKDVYTITVTKGTATVGGKEATKAVAGATVTITAEKAASGKAFDKWVVTGDKATLADANSETTTFTMPGEAVTVEATYKDVYAITVTKGTATVGGKAATTAAEGATVTITAEKAASGKVFDKWVVTGDAVTLDDETASTTTFEMPAKAVTVEATYKDAEYDITVTKGTATVGGKEATKAVAGATVTITADEPDAGKVFSKWVVTDDKATLADATKATTTFEMPAEAVTVEATYKAVHNITITDNKGTATVDGKEVTKAAEGDTVTIIGAAPEEGKAFDNWTVVSGGITLGKATSRITTFTMGTADVEVTANYKAADTTDYTITVDGGTATVNEAAVEKASEGTIVTLTAAAPEAGKAFDKWTVVSGDVTFADANSATTTFDMIAGNVSVKATYKDVYAITVTSGKATVDGEEVTEAAEGDTVTITANAAPSGKAFDKWVVTDDKVTLTDETKATTTFTMPAEAVTVEATYKATGGGSSGGGYVPPVTDPLPTTKTESTNAVQNYVKPADYEDAEAAEIKAIMDKAAEDIKNAKTAEEVKAIEAAAKEAIDKLDTAEEKAVIRTVEATKFRATSKRTTLNGKKAIKITWNKPDGVDFDGYDIYRSTKKNSGFGKTPFFTTTKQTYTNNKGLEVGKTYYYKVRGFKYVNGRKVYTEYSYKAIRTMK